MDNLGNGFCNVEWQRRCDLPAVPVSGEIPGVGMVSGLDKSQALSDQWLGMQGFRAISQTVGPDAGYTALSWEYVTETGYTAVERVKQQRLTAEIEAEQAATAAAAVTAATQADIARQAAKSMELKTLENKWMQTCAAVINAEVPVRLGINEMETILDGMDNQMLAAGLAIKFNSWGQAMFRLTNRNDWWDDIVWHPEIAP